VVKANAEFFNVKIHQKNWIIEINDWKMFAT
jgi:hypothetical protein